METFKDRQLRYARIAGLNNSIQLAWKRTMDTQDTLGLEDLDLKKTKPPRDYSKRRAHRRKGWPSNQQNDGQSSPNPFSEQNVSFEANGYPPPRPRLANHRCLPRRAILRVHNGARTSIPMPTEVFLVSLGISLGKALCPSTSLFKRTFLPETLGVRSTTDQAQDPL